MITLSIESIVELTLLLQQQLNNQHKSFSLELDICVVETTVDWSTAKLEVRVNGHKVCEDSVDAVSKNTMSLIIGDIQNHLNSWS